MIFDLFFAVLMLLGWLLFASILAFGLWRY